MAAAAVVSLLANTYIIVVPDRHMAARILPRVKFILKLLRYMTNTIAANNERSPIMLIAPHGMSFMHSPPKLHKIEAAAMPSGPLRFDRFIISRLSAD